MVDGHATIDAVLRDFIAWIEAQPYLIKHSEVRESVVQILRSTGARGWDACHLPQKDAVVLVSANVVSFALSCGSNGLSRRSASVACDLGEICAISELTRLF
eukprot:2627661-Rhodomonas_salina.3